MNSASLRSLPAVEKVLQTLGPCDLPRPLIVAVVRRELAALRTSANPRRGRGAPSADPTDPRPAHGRPPSPALGATRRPADPGAEAAPDSLESALTRVRMALDQLRCARLQPVINGTGVLLHTNLGRAPLSPEAVAALVGAAANYTNLEYDLPRGTRGPRAAYLEPALALLCAAEAATVVNNCAAALVLLLRHFTAGTRKQVLISRGELVQIGGGFRIPEILETSGARLREVGTTNQTTLADYARAVGRDTALILKVHRSNFFMGGFVQSPAPEALAALARKKRVPFVEDLGSGAAVGTQDFGTGEHEPTPAEVLARGADLVCFSGDKLLGGPQAGIIAGRRRLVQALARDPFFRALRCDKLILAALQATVDAYLGATADARPDIPVLNLLRVPNAQLRARADRLVAALAGLPFRASVGEGKAALGGGTLPRVKLTSVTLDLEPAHLALDTLAARLRAGSPPLIGYVSGGRFKLDLRTVFPHQDDAVIAALRTVAASAPLPTTLPP